MEAQTATNTSSFANSIVRSPAAPSSSRVLSLFSDNAFRRKVPSTSSVVEENNGAHHQTEEAVGKGMYEEEKNGNEHLTEEVEAGGRKKKKKKKSLDSQENPESRPTDEIEHGKRRRKKSLESIVPTHNDFSELTTENENIIEKNSEIESNRNRDESVSARRKVKVREVSETVVKKPETGRKRDKSVSARRKIEDEKVEGGSEKEETDIKTGKSISARRKMKKEEEESCTDDLEHIKEDKIKPLNHKKSEEDDLLEQNMHVEKQKINNISHILKVKKRPDAKVNTSDKKTVVPIQVKESENGVKIGAKRKKEETIEVQYEKRLGGSVNDDKVLSMKDKLSSANIKKDEKLKSQEKDQERAIKKKRTETNDDYDEPVNDAKIKQFDDEEKLKRTVFIGNLPLNVKKKALVKQFSQYGPIESARLRSIPLLDSKIPRKGAIMKGQINEAINSQHAYIVFGEALHANAALAHNMKEFNGNHIRVDAAHAPHGATNAKASLSYDYTRSLFIGNLPFDVKDEELYQIFTPELDVEAIRVVRDPHTSLSKGIAFVLFKTKESARRILSSKQKTRLRDRILRITRVLQNTKEKSTPIKHIRNSDVANDETSLQRKRAKLSASYEGIRATKEFKHAKKTKRPVDIKKKGSKGFTRLKGKKAARPKMRTT